MSPMHAVRHCHLTTRMNDCTRDCSVDQAEVERLKSEVTPSGLWFTVTAAELLTFDRVLAVAGLVITLWQLHRTRTAAEASSHAAESAVASIRRLSAATKLHDIVGRARELLRLLRTKGAAAAAAMELREAVARYRTDKESSLVVSEEVWQRILIDVKELHDRIESIELLGKASTADRADLVLEITRLLSDFSELAAKASVQGISNANPD